LNKIRPRLKSPPSGLENKEDGPAFAPKRVDRVGGKRKRQAYRPAK
jgi:hypothetical protein